MLSTSNKTRFQYQYLLIAVVIILATVSVIAVYQSGVMPSFSAAQVSVAVDLSWPPRPDFSQLNQQAIIPVTGNAAQIQGSSFNPGREADAARYVAMADFFAAKEAAGVQRGRDADAARYTAMAKLYAAQSERIQYGPPGR